MIWCKLRICGGDKNDSCLNARCRPPAPLPLAPLLTYADAWAHRLDRCVKAFTQPKAARGKRNGQPALPKPLLEPAEQGVASCAPSLPSPPTPCEAQADDYRGGRGGDGRDGGQGGVGSAEAHHDVASRGPDVLQGAECGSLGAECALLGAECALLGAECAILLEERGVRGWHETWGACVLGWLGQPCSDRGAKGSLRGLVLMAEQTDKTFMTCFLARLEAHCLEVTLDTCFAPSASSASRAAPCMQRASIATTLGMPRAGHAASAPRADFAAQPRSPASCVADATGVLPTDRRGACRARRAMHRASSCVWSKINPPSFANREVLSLQACWFCPASAAGTRPCHVPSPACPCASMLPRRDAASCQARGMFARQPSAPPTPSPIPPVPPGAC